MNTQTEKQVLKVHELNNRARGLLESTFGTLWIEGEISNLARPRSGHIYLTLKDEEAQVRGAFFKQSQRGLQMDLRDGQQVLVQARVSLYGPRGDYQLIIQRMEPAGAGKLQQAFEALKQKLQAKGWFDDRHKKPLPAIPQRIGIITSASGAALQDIIQVLGRRLPAVELVIYPCLVQGSKAAEALVQAIHTANTRQDVDLVILGRGGGSLEDLWPFNEESVAEAIFYSSLPILSAVGHQTDFTIADFVADLRAPTPSAAAELATPDWRELSGLFSGHAYRLEQALLKLLLGHKQTLTALARHIRHPSQKIQEQAQRLDQLEQRLVKLTLRQHQQADLRLTGLIKRLQQQKLHGQIKHWRASLSGLESRLVWQTQQLLKQKQQHTEQLGRRLLGMGPSQTLERGYVIAKNVAGVVIDKAEKTRAGDPLELTFIDGTCKVTVTS